MSEGYNPVPPINYDRNRDILIAEYKKAYKDLLAAIVDLTNAGDTETDIYQRQASTLRQIEVILANLDEVNKSWCEQEIAAAFANGRAAALLSAGFATSLVEAAQGVQYSLIAQQTVDALIADTQADLLKATKYTSESLKRLVRQEVGEVLRQRSIQRFGRNTMRNDIVKRLTKKGLSEKVKENGFVGIVDSAGRKWDLKRYADMVVRTKLSQAHTEGVRVEAINKGIDTAVISSHNAPDDCGKFEGMIISLHGLTPGLLTYNDLRTKSFEIFHPNCGHTVLLIRLKYFPQKLKDKHDQKVAAFSSEVFETPVTVSEIISPEKSQVKALL